MVDHAETPKVAVSEPTYLFRKLGMMKLGKVYDTIKFESASPGSISSYFRSTTYTLDFLDLITHN